ncbi:hypothetical protein E8E14_005746 [Neopestalotiopsis sp. 37M]|nr:hypothetical protein E8E14_005746 [Neopestalotiopsis sp. 37M]
MPCSTTALEIPDLSGQVIIVTGGTAGLGLECIRQLSTHNPAHIYLAARSQEKADTVIRELRDSIPEACPITFLSLDLSSFSSVKAAAAAFLRQETRLDILMNNAGIMMTPEGLTEDGYEVQFGTNVMGPALFTLLLLPLLQQTAKLNPQTRVVNLSSASEKVAPSDLYPFAELKTPMSSRHTTARYTMSKIACVHYTSALAQLYKEPKFISVHPGMVATNLHHNSTGIFLKPFLNAAIYFATPVEKGARSQLWAAVSPDARSGEFYGPVGVLDQGSKNSKQPELIDQLWDWMKQELIQSQIAGLPLLLALREPALRQAFTTALQSALTRWSLNAPRLNDLPTVARLNAFDALFRNAMVLQIPTEFLESDDGISLFNVLEPSSSDPSRAYPGDLAPTALQRTIVHHPWLDLLPIPRLRDNILRSVQAGDYDENFLCDGICCDLLTTDWSGAGQLIIWGDPWDANNWEFGEEFFRNWGFLLDGCTGTLNTTNYWREKRGEMRLDLFMNQ